MASALNHLHHDCQTPIIHCDLKPNNILLNNECVSDFGLAGFLAEGARIASHSQTSCLGLTGTIGYVAPECGITGEVSTQSDVFSYGVIALEMFTGKRPTDESFRDCLSLREFAKNAFPDRNMEIVDPALAIQEKNVNRADSGEIQDSMDIAMVECLVSLIVVGLQCSVPTSSARLNMSDVMKKMCGVKELYAEAVALE